MALTLQCTCGDDASICHLIKLTLSYVANKTVIPGGGGFPIIGAIHEIFLETGFPGEVITIGNPPNGGFSIDLPLIIWEPHYNSISIRMYMDASLVQFPDPVYSGYELFSFTYVIIQTYQCQNFSTGKVTEYNVFTFPARASGQVDCVTGDTTRGTLISNPGEFVTTFYLSTPGGGGGVCFSGPIAGDAHDFPPIDHEKISLSDSGQICLCVSGGSGGSYTFSIVAGNLASGQTLNPTTGCIEGEPDGAVPPSASVTFQVIDPGGAGVGPTGGVTIIGHANVFGAGATRLSGPGWGVVVPGTVMVVDGINATVDTVTDADHLTFTTAIGILPGVPWSYVTPIVPPPDPGPPDTAQVTCSFIGGGCSDSGGGIQNQAY